MKKLLRSMLAVLLFLPITVLAAQAQDMFGKWTFIKRSTTTVFELNRIEQGTNGKDVALGPIDSSAINALMGCVPSPWDVKRDTGLEFLCFSAPLGMYNVYGITFRDDIITEGIYGFGLSLNSAVFDMLSQKNPITGYRGDEPRQEPEKDPQPEPDPRPEPEHEPLTQQPHNVYDGNTGDLFIPMVQSDGASYEVVMHSDENLRFTVYSAIEIQSGSNAPWATQSAVYDIYSNKLYLNKVDYDGRTYRVEMINNEGVFTILSVLER